MNSTALASSSVAIRRASLSLAWPQVGLTGRSLDFSLERIMELDELTSQQ